MASAGERATSPRDENSDALPRTDVDLEAELEALREWAKHHVQFINHAVWVDLEELDARIEHISALLPKEIRRARRIARDEQRIIQDAKDEARRLLEEARAEAEQIVSVSREEADRLIEQSAIRQRALEQAEATIAQAKDSARAIRDQSYAYAHEVIGNVLESLKRLSQSVESDKAQLEQMPPDLP